MLATNPHSNPHSDMLVQPATSRDKPGQQHPLALGRASPSSFPEAAASSSDHRAQHRLTNATTKSFTVSNFTRAFASYTRINRSPPSSAAPDEAASTPSSYYSFPLSHSTSATPFNTPSYSRPPMPSFFPTSPSISEVLASPPPPPSASSPAVASQTRLSLLKALRQRRASVHVASYMRVIATVSSIRTFPVTVRRTDTIEDLARQIEAEYAFRYPCSLPPSPLAAAADDDSPRSTASPPGYPPAAPLICGSLLFNDTPLIFESIIGEVLHMDDTVTVVNLHDGAEDSTSHQASPVCPIAVTLPPVSTTSSSSSGPVSPPESFRPDQSVMSFDSLNSFASDKSETAQRAAIHHAPAIQFAPELAYISSPAKSQNLFTLERLTRLALPHVRFTNLLTSFSMVGYFLHHCLQVGEFAVESALFWLDVERFRVTQSNVCRLTANYIYITYLAPQAPLFVNIPKEVRDEIQWPFLPGWNLDVSVFDEAQEWVFQTMKHRLLTRFEKSDLFGDMWDDRRCLPQNYVQDQSTSLDRLQRWGSANIDVVLWINDLNFNDSDRPLVAELSRLSDEFREDLVKRIMEQFDPLPQTVKAVNGYFTHPKRITHLHKNLRMQRNKRLLKFFGEKPESEVLTPQLDLPLHSPSLSVLQRQQRQHTERLYGKTNDYLEGSSGRKRRQSTASNYLLGLDQPSMASSGASVYTQSSPCSASFPDNSSMFMSGNSSFMDDPNWNSYTRKKKFEKLEEFFGNRIPEEILVEQQLIDPRELADWRQPVGSVPSRNPSPSNSAKGHLDASFICLPTLETNNDLSAEQKRILTKRRKKLKYMLGEPLAEATVESNMNAPLLRTTLGRQRSYTTSDVDAASLRSPHSPMTDDWGERSPAKPLPIQSLRSVAGFTPLSPKPSAISHAATRSLSDKMARCSISQRRGQGQLDLFARGRTYSQPGQFRRPSDAVGAEFGGIRGPRLAQIDLSTLQNDPPNSVFAHTGSSIPFHPSPSLPDLRDYSDAIPGASSHRKNSEPLVGSDTISCSTAFLAQSPGLNLDPEIASLASSLSPATPLTAEFNEKNIRRRQFEKLRDVLGPNLPIETITTGLSTKGAVRGHVGGDENSHPGSTSIFNNKGSSKRNNYSRHMSMIGTGVGIRSAKSNQIFKVGPRDETSPVLPSGPSNLTPEEKSRRIKRANKLERMFGEHLPSKARIQLMNQPRPRQSIDRMEPALTRRSRENPNVAGTGAKPAVSPRSYHGYSHSYSHSPKESPSASFQTAYTSRPMSTYDEPPSFTSSTHPLLLLGSESPLSPPNNSHSASGWPPVRRGSVSQASLKKFLNDEDAVDDFIDYVTE
ncbi:hypothetical protein BJ085DRAFT_30033, partial [Dimargaris cristalligena]